MLHDAADVAGMTFTERELDAMLDAVNLNVGRLDEIHKAPMENAVALPLYFNPAVPGIRIERTKRPIRTSAPPRVTRPEKPAKRDGGHRSSRRAFGDRSEQRLARPAMNEGARGEVSLRMVPRPSAP